MAQKTDAELTTEKNIIKNETVAKANTATRVGTMFENLNDSKINNDKIDSADTLDTASKTVAGRDAVKAYVSAQLATLDVLFLGLYTSLGALETAHPTADSGQYAIVDPGPGTDAVKYLWDEDEGWVEGGSSGGGDFLTLTGDPYDNTALETALNAKADVFETQRDVSGAHTLDATDLVHVNDGEDYVLNNTTSGVLTLPLNATVDFPESTFIRVPGFTTVAAAVGGTVNGTNGTLNVVGDDSYVRYIGSDTWTLYNGEPAASSSTAGLAKLYPDLSASNTDGAPSQAAVKTANDLKSDALITTRPITGAHTLDATDLASINAGQSLYIQGNSTGDLTIPANATVAFAIGAGLLFSGFDNVVQAVGVTVTPSNSSLATDPDVKSAIVKEATNGWSLNNGTNLTALFAAKLDQTDLDTVAASPSAGTLTLDMNSQRQRRFLTPTQSSAFTLALSNTTNARVFHWIVRITGTVAITMPSDFRMSQREVDDGRWVTGTRILTLIGDTASPFELSAILDDTSGSAVWLLKASYKNV